LIGNLNIPRFADLYTIPNLYDHLNSLARSAFYGL